MITSRVYISQLTALTVLVVAAINFQCLTGSSVTRSSGLIHYPEPYDESTDQPNFIANQNRSAYPSYTRSRIRITLTRHINLQNDLPTAPEISYFGAVGVGKPANMFNVVFDTGSSETWLPEHNWFPLANNLHYSDGYKCKDSSTCQQLNREYTINYRNTKLEGETYDDSFTLYEDLQEKDDAAIMVTPSLSFRQNFLAIDDASDEQFRWKPYDGVIGLAPVPQSSSGIKNILISVQEEQQRQHSGDNMNNPSAPNQIRDELRHNLVRPGFNNNMYSPVRSDSGYADLMFSIWLNPNQNSRHGGELMLGGVDENRFIGDIYFHKIISWLEWQLSLNHVMLGSQVVSCHTTGCAVTIDTGATSVVGPREDVEAIYNDLQAQYQQASDLWLVDCNKINQYPILTFKIDDTPYALYPSHYVKIFKYKENFVCYLAIKPWNKQNHWLFGTTFIGGYYTVFDFANRRVGFATAR